MGEAPDFNDLARDDPEAAWRACGRAKAYKPLMVGVSSRGLGEPSFEPLRVFLAEPRP